VNIFYTFMELEHLRRAVVNMWLTFPEGDLVSDANGDVPLVIAEGTVEEVVGGLDPKGLEMTEDLGVWEVKETAGVALGTTSVSGSLCLGRLSGWLVSRACAWLRLRWSRQTVPACVHSDVVFLLYRGLIKYRRGSFMQDSRGPPLEGCSVATHKRGGTHLKAAP
jgi:hypothetical protein